jgi:MFS family permease
MSTSAALPGNGRVILSLAFSQAFNSACVPISLIVASLAVVKLSGGDSRWAGVPSAITLTGAALASFTAGRLLPSFGYRRILMAACLSGMAGCVTAAFASLREWFPLFLCAFLFIGSAIGLIGLSRYAAAEVSGPAERARSMGRVVMGATAGAILGPFLVPPFGRLAEWAGLPNLTGPWLAAFLFYAAAFANTFFLLRPEPKELARQRAAGLAGAPGHLSAASSATLSAKNRPLAALLRDGRILLPMGSLVAAQMAMVLVMAITPLHMHSHHHHMGTISYVITAHFVGMYGLSALSGRLADRLGRMPTVGLGGGVLVLACLLAPVSHHSLPLTAALFLLGLGWSFCFLGASTALSEGLAEGERGRVQGLTEALVSMASGMASLGSGVLFATFGFSAMTWVGLGISMLPLVLFLIHRTSQALPKKPEVSLGA